MANLVDKSYFFGNLSIAQLSQDAVSNTLTWYINELEPKLLEYLMGYELYLKYKVGVTVPTQKYIDIRDGAEYIGFDGIKKKWKGLIFAESSTKKSLIANYVYYNYIIDNVSFTTGSGQKKVKTESSEDTTPKIKLARAWNEMVDWNKQLVEMLQVRFEDYPDFQNYYGNCELDNLLSRANPIF